MSVYTMRVLLILRRKKMSIFKRFLGNTHLPHKKSTADISPVRMENVGEVLLPMSQHIGAPAIPTVAVGDTVKVGQRIADAQGSVSSPVYASISGRVKAIENYMSHNGKTAPAIRIESDGLMELYEGLKKPEVHDLAGLIAAASESGLVGLGGAGFPTGVKLNALLSGKIDTIVINAAECEPYITSDTRTILGGSEWIYKGIALLETYTSGISKYVFGVEKNKPRCISHLKELFAKNPKVSITPLPALYPQGAEKVLIYNTVKRIVPEGGLPSDVGVIVINVTTLSVLAKYIETGLPLVEKCVTVDGSAVREPKNIVAPIGTPICALTEFAGGLYDDVGKVLLGGPMMGQAVCSLDEPITKMTNAVTILNKKESSAPIETACIHCGRCISACPLSLNPVEYSRATDLSDKEERIARLEKFKVMLCMECGCCSYVCPAKRPLVENNRLAKNELRTYKAHSSMLKK